MTCQHAYISAARPLTWENTEMYVIRTLRDGKRTKKDRIVGLRGMLNFVRRSDKSSISFSPYMERNVPEISEFL